jgi:hypothetical protein
MESEYRWITWGEINPKRLERKWNDFNLVKAERRKQPKPQIKPAMVSANYGKVETKRAIANVLSGVVDQYKFTSIPELNAVLRKYNVMADRGSENSQRIRKAAFTIDS